MILFFLVDRFSEHLFSKIDSAIIVGHKGKRRMDKGIQVQGGIRVRGYKGHKGNGIKGHNRVNGCKVKYA